jgi:endo-1,4-beta-xylanase
MWGIDDRNSWLSTGNPCLFDRYLNPKKAFNAVFNPEKHAVIEEFCHIEDI